MAWSRSDFDVLVYGESIWQLGDEDGMGVALIEIPVDAVVSAAARLARAGASDAALALLPAGSQDARVLLARAQVEIGRSYSTGTRGPRAGLLRARAAVARSEDLVLAWDVGLLQVRADLYDALFTPGTRLGSDEGRDPATVERLREAIDHLRSTAPDDGRRAWADFMLGTVFDNLYGVRDVAPALYRSALAPALAAGDDYLVYEVLRHLGDHSHDGGEMDVAREEWEASAFHAARSGSALAVLNQLILLAQLARERGDEAGARLLGSEVGRWAEGLGATRLHRQATDFIAGADPTRDDG